MKYVFANAGLWSLAVLAKCDGAMDPAPIDVQPTSPSIDHVIEYDIRLAPESHSVPHLLEEHCYMASLAPVEEGIDFCPTYHPAAIYSKP